MSTNYDKSNLKAKDSSEQSLIEMSISNGVGPEPAKVCYMKIAHRATGC